MTICCLRLHYASVFGYHLGIVFTPGLFRHVWGLKVNDGKCSFPIFKYHHFFCGRDHLEFSSNHFPCYHLPVDLVEGQWASRCQRGCSKAARCLEVWIWLLAVGLQEGSREVLRYCHCCRPHSLRCTFWLIYHECSSPFPFLEQSMHMLTSKLSSVA